MTGAEAVPRIGGVALLRADGAALLQLRDDKPEINDPNVWVFPGGHCEPDEPDDVCAAREFQEETQYRCGALHYLATFRGRDLGYRRDFELRLYWSLFDGRQEYVCCEGQDLRFVTLDEAESLPMPVYLRDVWRRAIAEAGLKR